MVPIRLKTSLHSHISWQVFLLNVNSSGFIKPCTVLLMKISGTSGRQCEVHAAQDRFLSLALSPQCCLSCMSHERQQRERKEHPAAVFQIPTLHSLLLSTTVSLSLCWTTQHSKIKSTSARVCFVTHWYTTLASWGLLVFCSLAPLVGFSVFRGELWKKPVKLKG